jgi:hypothetical protein
MERCGSTPTLETALYRAQSGYYADLIEEAAALWESLAQNHAFIDGNKRGFRRHLYVSRHQRRAASGRCRGDLHKAPDSIGFAPHAGPIANAADCEPAIVGAPIDLPGNNMPRPYSSRKITFTVTGAAPGFPSL